MKEEIKEKRPEIYKNREMSWLQFNERVLEEAENTVKTPVLERLRFLSIFMSNLDEFYRVRVGMLCDQLLLDEGWTDSQTGKNAGQQLREIWKGTKKLLPRFNSAYSEATESMKKYNIYHVGYGETFVDKDVAYLQNIFKNKIAPFVAPFIVERKHPLPFFENEQLVIGVTLRTKKGNVRFGFIPIPDALARVIWLPSTAGHFILLEELILMFAHRIFHKFKVEEKAIFMIVRSAEIDENDGLYDYDADFADTMEKIIDVRDMLEPVKIKYYGTDTKILLNYLAKTLYLKKKQFFAYKTPLEFDFISELEPLLTKKVKAKITYPPRKPSKNSEIDENGDLIAQVLEKDVLMSYPFEDISTMIALLEQAAKDERVTEISLTLYRAAKKSKIIAALIDAVKNGKKVNCVVELRARFDEEHNVDLAERLQEAGVFVEYGIPGYKVHSKLLLIELKDGRKLCQVGTGNFNETTAKFYTDLALITAHTGITKDVKQVFDTIMTDTFVEQADHLLVSPLGMKSGLMNLIDEEIARAKEGFPAGIVMKMNSLTEKDTIKKLVEASKAGVKIDLIIRGICCLIPGVEGETENITVRSLVGRYLEHSRIFAFGAGRGNEKKYYISSADIMTRNLTGRVEAAVPIYDRECKAKVRQILNLNLHDNVNARVQRPNGKYCLVKKRQRQKARDSQEILMLSAMEKAKRLSK